MSELNNGNTRIAELVFKYLVKQLSDEERIELEKWKSGSEENHTMFNEMVQRAQLKAKLQDYNNVNSENIWNKISRSASISLAPISIKKNRWWYAVAATVVPVIAICAWLYLKPASKSKSTPAITVNNSDILPGSNKGILTLANGSTIILDEAKDGSLARQGNTSVAKHGGQIVYNANASNTGEIGYNTIATPRGGQYQIGLADGSRVFLNAASSLRFPVAFNGAERKVVVTGEAYFEIAKDPSRPFIVVIDGPDQKAEVEVLGTHFNINGYLNEPSIQTTLLEGKVKIRTSPSNSKILSPGQQAQVLSSGTIQLRQVDTLAAVAWKNGVFRFGETDIRTVLRQIERWYDVEIIYKGEIPAIEFVGQISRYAHASKVLELLEMTGGVRFEIHGKQIFVLPPEQKQ